MASADTIMALSSGAGRAAIAVLRISGPCAFSAAKALGADNCEPRLAKLVRLRDPNNGEVLDKALVLAFKAPASFSGEDLVEFHLHGGSAVVSAVMRALGAHDVRLAGPGEFTRRAFHAGKLDLAEAEALADLIDAQTDAQRRQALAQMEGGLSARVAAWRADLISAQAFLEAAIDFPDEDLPENTAARTRPIILHLLEELRQSLATADRGMRVREGLQIALIGPVNAGKSTLLNALAGRDIAITSHIPGTTRDVLETSLDLNGYPATLIDTAGLRETGDLVEIEGVRRARRSAETADIRLYLNPPIDPGAWRKLNVSAHARDILIHSMSDLKPFAADLDWQGEQIAISALTGAGLEELLAVLVARAAEMMAPGNSALITRERHKQAIEVAIQSLQSALAANIQRPELIAEHVRHALVALERLIGRVDSEEVLGAIFSQFCIGK